MPASNNSDLADQVPKASQSEAHKQSVPKQSRPMEQQAPNKKPKLSAKPQKLPAAHQPARRLSLTKSDTAAQTEPESKPRQVGIYDRPWRKHMKSSSTDRQPGQQEAAAAAAAAPVRERQPAGPKVIAKWHKMLAHCSMCPRVLLSHNAKYNKTDTVNCNHHPISCIVHAIISFKSNPDFSCRILCPVSHSSMLLCLT